MIFNGSAGNSLIEDITFLTGVDTTQFTLADRTRYINEGYSKVAEIMINTAGRMGFDDPNFSDLPIADCNLVNAQKDYEVFSATPAINQDWLYIERVDIYDEAGIGHELQPIDITDLDGTAISEFENQPGQPNFYDFNGAILTLYPAPNYNYTKGIRMWFKRTPSYFTTTDTAKRPGFATTLHQYLSKYAAYVYNSTKKKDFSLGVELQKLELDLGRHYSKRAKYETPIISNKRAKFIK